MAFVQAGSVSSGAAAAVTISFGAPSTAGNLMIANYGYGTASSDGTVTDGGGNTYNNSIPRVASGIRTLQERYASNIGTAGSITFNYTAAVTSNQSYFEFSGMATVAPLDIAGSATGINTAAGTTATITTTNANDLLFISTQVSNAETSITPSLGYTQRSFLTRSSQADQSVSATGNYAGTWTYVATTTDWAAGISAYKTAGGAAATTPLGYLSLLGVGKA